MKKFFLRLTVLVLMVVLFVGAIYTCSIAATMVLLSNDVAEAELYVASGDPHMRAAADITYERVMEQRQELYYGGGYKSWFSTLPKVLQVLGVIGSIAVMCFEGSLFYSIYKDRKERKLRRKKAAQRKIAKQY